MQNVQRYVRVSHLVRPKTGHVVTTSFHGKIQKLSCKFKDCIFINLLDCIFMDEPNLRSIKKKSTEKELGDHTLKDLLYNQIFYTILREKLKAEITLTESGSRKYF